MDSLIEIKNWFYYAVDETNTSINKISGCERTRRNTNSIQEQVRLNEKGVVEFKHIREWGGICSDGFTIKEADVLCKQFGFELGAANVGENFEERYPGPIHIFDLSCRGDESDVIICYKY